MAAGLAGSFEPPTRKEWHVHKFGGTSVGDAKCFRRVEEIISQVCGRGVRPAIVVSAMGGKPKTTDMLIQLTQHAAVNDWSKVDEVLGAIRVKHEVCLRELFGDSQECQRLHAAVERDLQEIVSLLRAVTVMRQAPDSIVGIVSGYGEQWSAQFLQAMLASGPDANWTYLDARQVLEVDGGGSPDIAICWPESSAKLQKFLTEKVTDGGGLVITGFIASNRSGGSTTLGRDGSDFSASVFGRLLNAAEITIWTDVSGVLSADPRKVPDAYSLPEVSYKEAAELAYFGAKVVHPKTMLPAFARPDRPSAWGSGTKSIPLFIKNTFAPLDPGTRIFESCEATTCRPAVVAGFTAVDSMALVSIEGLGMQGCPGVASRLFSALHTSGISVVLIAQASSEQSICVLVEQKDGERAKAATLDAFARELEVGSIESVGVTSPCTVVAAVGDAMPQTAGVAGKFFDALGTSGVNVLAIAQGRNQRNISAVVSAADSNKALQALHAAFLTVVPIALGVIGAGRIAEAFLESIATRSKELAENFGVDLRIVAACDPVDRSACSWQGHTERRGKLAVADAGQMLNPCTLLSQLAEHGKDMGAESVTAMVDRINSSPLVHKVIVDCSDSKFAAGFYHKWLKEGFHVVSQNYVGHVGASSDAADTQGWVANFADDLQRLLGTGPRLLLGAAVGRGLPLLPTISVLGESGDRIVLVDGVFSLSLHFICSKVSPADGSKAVSFDEAFRLAAEMGLLEQNDTLDLTGKNSRLQLILLASQLPGTDDFQVDVEPVTEAALTAMASNTENVVRYVGTIDVLARRGSLKLTLLPKSHPFAQLPHDSRSARFYTQHRGPDSPVTVSGPVGYSLVGDALLADCLSLAKRFGAQKAQVLGPSSASQEKNLQRLIHMRRAQSSHRFTTLAGPESS